MWVKLKQNYTGDCGIFVKDQRLDLPEQTAKMLVRKKICIVTCPPWDDNKDHRLAKKGELLAHEAKLSRQIDQLKQSLAVSQQYAAKIPAIQELLAELEPKYKAVLEQLESFDKRKKNAAPEPAAETDAANPEPKDGDDAAGQTTETGQSE